MRDIALWALARCPFLAADDLAVLSGTSPRAARAQLVRLCRAALAEYVTLPGTRVHLYYLTAAGITAAARAAEAEPDELTARYGLGERALLRRLPALTRLVAGRRVLLALHRALAGQGGALEEWRAWPVRWRAVQGTHPCALDMDGEATIVLPGRAAGRWRVGYLWDGEATVPREVLWERLEQLDAMSRSEAYTTPRPARVPPVLLVTAETGRVPPGYHPGLLWTTTADSAGHGPLAAPWHGAHLHGAIHPLAAALATLGTLPPRPTPGSSLAPASAGTAVPRLAQRARDLRDGVRGSAHDSPLLLALAVPPRAWAILEVVGAHPLLAATSVAEACTLARSDAWHLLMALCRHGLLVSWTPSGGPRRQRYVLSTRGLHLLARRAGITPQAYRRIYGALDDACGEARRGLVFARANLAHTDGINSVYLALLGASRVTGGGLGWRGEWACTHTYLAGQHLHTLRPDAEGLFMGLRGRCMSTWRSTVARHACGAWPASSASTMPTVPARISDTSPSCLSRAGRGAAGRPCA